MTKFDSIPGQVGSKSFNKVYRRGLGAFILVVVDTSKRTQLGYGRVKSFVSGKVVREKPTRTYCHSTLNPRAV